MKKALALMAVLALAAPAMAGFTATNAGPLDSNGAAGDATNGVFTYNYAGADFVPGTLTFSGTATSGGITSYLSELRWQITNPALEVGISPELTTGTSWTGAQAIGPVTFTGLNNVFTGTSVGTWEFRAFESYDDSYSNPALVDATWTNVSFEIQDYVPLNPTYYYDEPSFQAALAGPYYVEDFSDYTYGDPLDGNQTSQAYGPVNGFAYNARSANGLWSNESSLSTNQELDALTLEFTGAPVTAFGGNMVVTDKDGNIIAGDLVVTLADMTQITLSNQVASSFFGVTTEIPMLSITFEPDPEADDAWIQLDHLYVGQVPEPASLALLVLGGLAAIRRRR
ncbi:MAG: PEP-CTERM sorting domain-containing protein [Phycisphaerae bacterium]|nr:PEP-CTERM sorting domain-containing protein [Phycisphaerae bacterium]